MPLIKSIAGIRGTIGGSPGENLTPQDIIRFTTAYALFLQGNMALKDGLIGTGKKIKVIVGRDGRVSGEMIKNLVVGTLLSQGINVVDLGMATTPTVEMAVPEQKAQGGVVITASHNPAGWNGLKFLNAAGEFLSAAEGQKILKLAAEENSTAVSEDKIGAYIFNPYLSEEHLREIISLPLVNSETITAKDFKIVVDGINSVGGQIVPNLLQMLGVKTKNIIELNCEPNGLFAHKPEPLKENLTQIMDKVRTEKADLGIVVDPDVDRLAFIDENGEVFGEEYTLVAVADYVLKNYDIMVNDLNGNLGEKNLTSAAGGSGETAIMYKKAAVSNLSSSRALKELTEKYEGIYEAAAVGEVNVVQKMKEIGAVIGGEGNGGVIYPLLHYGRDALVGIALFLTALAKSGQTMSEFRCQFPEYFMIKDKINLTPDLDIPALLSGLKNTYKNEKVTDIDGVKIDWDDSWVHLRASNTEPIIRIYAEARTEAVAVAKVKEIKDKILAYISY